MMFRLFLVLSLAGTCLVLSGEMLGAARHLQKIPDVAGHFGKFLKKARLQIQELQPDKYSNKVAKGIIYISDYENLISLPSKSELGRMIKLGYADQLGVKPEELRELHTLSKLALESREAMSEFGDALYQLDVPYHDGSSRTTLDTLIETLLDYSPTNPPVSNLHESFISYIEGRSLPSQKTYDWLMDNLAVAGTLGRDLEHALGEPYENALAAQKEAREYAKQASKLRKKALQEQKKRLAQSADTEVP